MTWFFVLVFFFVILVFFFSSEVFTSEVLAQVHHPTDVPTGLLDQRWLGAGTVCRARGVWVCIHVACTQLYRYALSVVHKVQP